MEATGKWGLGVVAVLAMVASVILLGPHAWGAVQRKRAAPEVFFSQTGRDRAFTQGVQEAKRSIYLRTSSLLLVPFTNEIGQAAQRGIKVHVEMPMRNAVVSQDETKCVEFLASVGGWLELGSRPAAAYEGAYLLIDDRVFYYSAGTLAYSEPGIPHSYVRGTKG